MSGPVIIIPGLFGSGSGWDTIIILITSGQRSDSQNGTKMKVIRLILFLFMAILFSCEEVVLVDCNKCTREEPADADLSIKLSDTYNTSRISDINIYEGDLEDNILFGTTSAYSKGITYKVPLNKKYTVTVTYYLSSGTYTAVDSALPRVKYDKDQCDNPCYYVYDNSINLKLKYQ